MCRTKNSLAGQLLATYLSGSSLSAISALTGLSEQSVLTRLCAASNALNVSGADLIDEEGGIGVQWKYVCWRA